MNQLMKNKEFILEYFNNVSGQAKTDELLARYISDNVLIEHILFFESIFPQYEFIADEMTAEGNRVVVRAHKIGKHEGVFGEIQPTHRTVQIPFVISYTVENRKIVSHWIIADQTTLMEQLGVEPALAAH